MSQLSLYGSDTFQQVDTTLIYLKADLTLKQAALDRVTPLGTATGRYHPPDAVLAFLDSL